MTTNEQQISNLSRCVMAFVKTIPNVAAELVWSSIANQAIGAWLYHPRTHTRLAFVGFRKPTVELYDFGWGEDALLMGIENITGRKIRASVRAKTPPRAFYAHV